jgi:hypothetical protein
MANGGEEDEGPRFRVIDGGGQGRPPVDHHAAWVQAHLHALTIDMLRSIVNDEDRQGKVATVLQALVEEYNQTTTSLPTLVNGVIDQLHKSVSNRRDWSEWDAEEQSIVRAALRVAAESFCKDPAVEGRRSKRGRELGQRISQHVEGMERRRREHARPKGTAKPKRPTDKLIRERIEALMRRDDT